MENYSIFGSEISSAPTPAVAHEEPPIGNGHELMLPHQKRLLLDELRFTGEDSGHTLEAWARKDIEGTLQLLADRAQYITGASGAAIALRDGEDIICRASSGPAAPEIGAFLHVNSGLSGDSIRTRKVLRCDDAAADPRVNHESCRALGIASFAVMPLIREDQVIGIIEIFSGLPNSFEERDIVALQRIGEMVNTALDHVVRPHAAMAGLEVGEIHLREEISPEETSDAAPASVDFHETQRALPGAGKLSADQRRALNEQGICTCAVCGFPVAEDRVLCVDCESAPAQSAPEPPAAALDDQLPPLPAAVALHSAQILSSSAYGKTPSFFPESLLDPEPAREPGLKGWIVTHKYLVGAIAVVGSALVMLLLH
jgi:GAF domain